MRKYAPQPGDLASPGDHDTVRMVAPVLVLGRRLQQVYEPHSDAVAALCPTFAANSLLNKAAF
jgi:hypothetical protein